MNVRATKLGWIVECHDLELTHGEIRIKDVCIDAVFRTCHSGGVGQRGPARTADTAGTSVIPGPAYDAGSLR